LLDNNSVASDTRERNVLVGDSRDRACGAGYGFDADAIVRVDYCRGGDGNIFYNVVASAANGANGEPVATGAVSVGEGDTLFFFKSDQFCQKEKHRAYRSRVDGKAVILVLYICSSDKNVGAAANIECICVMA
jgi:hypothetical protein